MSFSNLNLCSSLLKALDKSGYKEPTTIQALAIPEALQRKDVIAVAQTGTGKTAAFVLPALQLLIDQGDDKRPNHAQKPRILILAPVRELANQITDAIYKYSSYTKFKVASIVGGMPYHAQMRQLSRPLDIIVATPGRLMDYIDRGCVDLSQVQMLVLDEADRMLDMGFIEDIKHISQYLPKQRQSLLFTATLNNHIRQLATRLLSDPVHVQQENESVAVDRIEQKVYLADDMYHKKDILQHILSNQSIYKAIIFSATKIQADRITDELRDVGFAAVALHGDIRQQKRSRILNQFKNGKVNLLVATDVVARGIDISDISHVINFDLPKNAEEYVHRIGRSGRAGREGAAISLVSADQIRTLKDIEHYIKLKLERLTIEGLEPKVKEHSFEHGRKPDKRSAGKNSSSHSKRKFSKDFSTSRGGERKGFSANRSSERKDFSAGRGSERKEFSSSRGGERKDFPASRGNERTEYRGKPGQAKARTKPTTGFENQEQRAPRRNPKAPSTMKPMERPFKPKTKPAGTFTAASASRKKLSLKKPNKAKPAYSN